MELLLLLPLLLFGGLLGGGSGDDGDDGPSGAAGEVEAGTSGPDELAGTVLNDILLGGAGRDTIEGLQGNDVIVGEVGNDMLTGDAGNDVVLGGAGNDLVDGSFGNDLLIGGAGNDTVTGGPGNDLLIGSSGADVLRGGDGNDTLIGLEFDSITTVMQGTAAELRDTLSRNFGSAVTEQQLNRVSAGVTSGQLSERGADVLEGGDGNDLLLGDDGDTMTGGLGVDDFGVSLRLGQATSTITDFDPLSETLTLLINNPDSASITIGQSGASNSLLSVDGQPAVLFLGRTVAELSANTSGWLILERP